ncbi:hypothetical protein LC085_17050 [Bacillus tianshenii]|uniref:hypothetical protein n=1 Tax=Sutcliffiella tianshenii TaxID=1463404 RepID=UPI001CD36220|nr:hypothetical protein [Bacillus tianshenii]MCA1321616.1 hypothetical protein [Bacillus tianshenii]
MKKIAMIVMMCFMMIGCAPEQNMNKEQSSGEEESWAYEFVKYNGANYEVTSTEATEDVKGEKLGEVERNIVDMDVEGESEEVDFDSNSLEVGTPLYQHTENSESLLYEMDGKLFILEKKK